MERCPRCSFPIFGLALECSKCHFPLTQAGAIAAPARAPLIGAEKAKEIRRKALAAIVIGLLMRVYWGAHGPWPVPNDPTLLSLRNWLEPLFLTGGVIAYAAGWVLRWF